MRISKFKKGFTLVELLIAASIVAILAMFSTLAYRTSVAETRIAGAKAKVNMLASAYQRFMAENPGWYLADSYMTDNADSSCDLSNSEPGGMGASFLVSCGYVERQGWGTDPYFSYQVYEEAYTDAGAPLACAISKSVAKLPEKFRGKKYCVLKNGATNDEFKNH